MIHSLCVCFFSSFFPGKCKESRVYLLSGMHWPITNLNPSQHFLLFKKLKEKKKKHDQMFVPHQQAIRTSSKRLFLNFYYSSWQIQSLAALFHTPVQMLIDIIDQPVSWQQLSAFLQPGAPPGFLGPAGRCAIWGPQSNSIKQLWVCVIF